MAKSKKATSNGKKFPKFSGKKKAFYEALMEARSIILQQVRFHTDEALKCERDSAGERAGVSTHMADLGSDNSMHDMELQLLTEEGDVLELIEEAIQRLENDEFGLCQDCGCKIQEDRLKVKPYARYCIRCKSVREANGGYNPEYDG